MSRSTTTLVSSVADPSHIVARLSELGYSFAPVRTVDSSLLDTFDGRLNRAGLRLEVRDEDGLRLILNGADAIAVEVSVRELPTSPDELPAGAFRDRLAAVVGIRALRPVVHVGSSRWAASRRDAYGKAIATVTVHARPRLLLPGAEVRLAETVVEIDELVGYHGSADSAVGALEQLGLERSPDDLFAFAAIAGHIDLAGFADSPTIDLDPQMPLIDGFRAVLANLADTAIANWQGTIDRVDPEFLHDLRVAIRRTRTVLASGKHVLPDVIGEPARAHFGALGALTGPARDLDVYLLEWDSYTAPLGAPAADALEAVRAWVEHERDAAYRTLASALRSPDETTFIDEWRTSLRTPRLQPSDTQPSDTQHADRRLGPFVATRIARAQSRLIDDGRLISPDSPAEQVHDLRKEAKKLRYLLECFGSLLAPKPLKQFVRRLKALQDNLGEHQDAEVHIAELRTISHHIHGGGAGPETMIAIGQLTERLDRRRLDARAEFAAQFAAYDTPATTDALHDALNDLAR